MSASNSSTPFDLVLNSYGLNLAADTSGLLVETVFTSVYGVIFALAVYSIFRKGFKSRVSFVMLGVVTYLYASALTMWALDITVVFGYIHFLFMDPPGTPLADRVSSPILMPPFGIKETLYMLNMIVGDSVVIWRVWVLFPRRRWVVLIPSVMLLISFVCGVLYLASHMAVRDGPTDGRMKIFDDSGLFMSWVFSLVTNVSCTIIIGIKAWHHRRMMRTLCTSRRMATEKVLSLLVECGFIYCLFWLTQIVQIFTDLSGETMLNPLAVLGDFGDQVSGMYPTLIIVIANFHRTIWDDESSLNTGQSKNQTKNTVSELRWAAPSEISGSSPGVEEVISTGDGKEVPSEMV
ncbi:hypothetical protein B0H19DRAFT_126584 [Mycena capillaripes]|nr:hypothetical protein B0H19DRAFT_126584 [Mycena capillaripes]